MRGVQNYSVLCNLNLFRYLRLWDKIDGVVTPLNFLR